MGEGCQIKTYVATGLGSLVLAQGDPSSISPNSSPTLDVSYGPPCPAAPQGQVPTPACRPKEQEWAKAFFEGLG